MRRSTHAKVHKWAGRAATFETTRLLPFVAHQSPYSTLWAGKISRGLERPLRDADRRRRAVRAAKRSVRGVAIAEKLAAVALFKVRRWTPRWWKMVRFAATTATQKQHLASLTTYQPCVMNTKNIVCCFGECGDSIRGASAVILLSKNGRGGSKYMARHRTFKDRA